MLKRTVLLGILIVIFSFSGGCWANDNNKIKSWQEWVKIPLSDKKEPKISAEPGKGTTLDELTVEQITVDLYFARQDDKGVEVEKRQIVKEEAIGRKTMEALLAGPQNPNLKSVLPAGTQLLDINVKPDGLCVVDFSQEIKKVSSEEAEVMAVYSIVNTLVQFPTVDRVSLMVEGEPVDTLAGYFDLSRPVIADYAAGRD